MIIDLHGLTVAEATSMVLSSLLSFDNSSFDNTLTIITGKGTGALMNAILTLLEQEGRDFYILNPGSIVVNKKHENEINDWGTFNNPFGNDFLFEDTSTNEFLAFQKMELMDYIDNNINDFGDFDNTFEDDYFENNSFIWSKRKK